MPYTKEQLENNEYFQNLKLEANREYEDERNRVLLEFQASASMETNTQVLRTGPGGPILSYENPETNTDMMTHQVGITVSRKQPLYKRGDELNEVIDRNFKFQWQVNYQIEIDFY